MTFEYPSSHEAGFIWSRNFYAPPTSTKKTPAFIDLLIFNASKISVLKLMTVYAQFPILEAQGYNDRFDIWMKIFCSQ